MAAIGIDLGTTNSCVAAIMPDGTVQSIIRTKLGHRTIPSVVGFCGENIYFGNTALGKISKHPGNVLHGVKSIIGRRFTDSTVQAFIKEIDYTVTGNCEYMGMTLNKSFKGTNSYKPEEVCGLFLKELKSYAEAHLDKPIEVTVITVPTYFEDFSRQATIDAGIIAGFKIVHLLNESTAAALAYGHKFDQESTVLVFDLGGGTFEVSVLRLQKDACSVLATDGNLHLGDNDIDSNVVKHILERIKNEYGEDITNKFKIQRLRTLCEQAKIKLSEVDQTEINITQFLRTDKDILINVNRDAFNELNEELFKKCMEIMEKCLKRINFTTKDIDVVLLVGGSTRNSYICSQIKEYFKNVRIYVNPEESIAIGAAIHAANLTKSSLREVAVQQLTAHSLGISTLYLQTRVRKVDIIIPLFSKMPTKMCKAFKITKGLTALTINIYSGASKDPNENNLLGFFIIKNIQADNKKVQVTFTVNSNGILEVTADVQEGASGLLDVTLNKCRSIRANEMEMLLQRIEKLYIDNK